MGDMSTLPIGNVPQWDLADRLGKALRESDVGVGEMAEYLGMSRNTVGNYLSGRRRPDRATVIAWALRTGVAFAWLSGNDNMPPTSGHARTGVWDASPSQPLRLVA